MGKIIEFAGCIGVGGAYRRKTKEPNFSREDTILQIYMHGEARYVAAIQDLYYSGRDAATLRRQLEIEQEKLDEANAKSLATIIYSAFPQYAARAIEARTIISSSQVYVRDLASAETPFGIRVFATERFDMLMERVRKLQEDEILHT